MSDVRAQITEIAQRLVPICRHVSVRDDEVGPFILAVSNDDEHSLELRLIDGEFVLELWKGKTAEDESLEEESRLADAKSAVERSMLWLHSDAV